MVHQLVAEVVVSFSHSYYVLYELCFSVFYLSFSVSFFIAFELKLFLT